MNPCLQDKFPVAIRAFDFAVLEFQIYLRVSQCTAAAIAGYGDLFDFDNFGRFGRLRHGVFASRKR